MFPNSKSLPLLELQSLSNPLPINSFFKLQKDSKHEDCFESKAVFVRGSRRYLKNEFIGSGFDRLYLKFKKRGEIVWIVEFVGHGILLLSLLGGHLKDWRRIPWHQFSTIQSLSLFLNFKQNLSITANNSFFKRKRIQSTKTALNPFASLHLRGSRRYLKNEFIGSGFDRLYLKFKKRGEIVWIVEFVGHGILLLSLLGGHPKRLRRRIPWPTNSTIQTISPLFFK